MMLGTTHTRTMFLLLSLLIIVPLARCRTLGTAGTFFGPNSHSDSKHASKPNHHAALVTKNNANNSHQRTSDFGDGNATGGHPSHIAMAGWNWEYVRHHFIITIFLILAAIAKVGFHHAGSLPQIIPESCLLIVLGTIVGSILHVTNDDLFVTLEPGFFFLVLLPPIILDSAYSLYDRVFFGNLGTILLFAVVGTILNFFIIGPALYGLAACGAMGTFTISLIECLVFSSLIVAVDPVAVLAIFQEIGVNNVLYFMVFGESLLNDAVTIVIYNMMTAFNEMETIPVSQIFVGIASFFSVSLIGMAIGIVFGLVTALITRCTEKVRVVEPLAIFTFAYASYLTADLFELSGIISILSCGMVQAHFSFHNVSNKSLTTVLYFSKIISTTSECIIFLFLGLALVHRSHLWHTGFVLWTIVLCFVVRFIGVYFLSFLANSMQRMRKIDFEEQFIMAYGGLRGAVAFSLVALLRKEDLSEGMLEIFSTTTLVIVLFTVFVQGITIKPLVKLLRIRREGEKVVSLCDAITDHVTDHVMAGIEEIVGNRGRNTLREMLDHFDDVYLKRIFQSDPMTKDEHIMELYKEIALQDHYDSLAKNVNMGRYSIHMNLYQPCEPSIEDETFTNMAIITPELADMTLDGTLRRRSMLAKRRYQGMRNRFMTDPGPEDENNFQDQDGGIGVPRRTVSLTKQNSANGISLRNFQKSFIEPTKVLHQKFDWNLNTETSKDLATLLQEKQLRTTRYIRTMSMENDPRLASRSNSSPQYASDLLNRRRPMSLSTIEEAHKDSTSAKDDSLLRHPNSSPQAVSHRVRSATYAGVTSHPTVGGNHSPKLGLISETDKQSCTSSDISDSTGTNQSESLALVPGDGKKDTGCLMRRTQLARQDKVVDTSSAIPLEELNPKDGADVSFSQQSDRPKPQNGNTQV